MSVPKAKARPQITMIFPELDQNGDHGKMLSKFEFKGMVNGGYTIKGKLVDPNFNILNKLVDSGYFKNSRTKPVLVRFQIRWGTKEETSFPETATKEQIAYLISLKATGEQSADNGILEFIAMDPPSWLLNMGDGNGGVYKGRVSDAIKQVVNEYAPGIELQISRTIDSKEGKWWMMRQDPKTFISSLFDWSSSVTKDKTQWIFTPDGNSLVIKEQAELISKQRGFYRFMEQNDHDTIRNWEFLADNALSVVQTKLITQGISAVSGQYLDRITDKDEEKSSQKTTIPRIRRSPISSQIKALQNHQMILYCGAGGINLKKSDGRPWQQSQKSIQQEILDFDTTSISMVAREPCGSILSTR